LYLEITKMSEFSSSCFLLLFPRLWTRKNVWDQQNQENTYDNRIRRMHPMI
jgi:hypothetical protein